MMLNPWIILAALIGLLSGGVYTYEAGVHHGETTQYAIDQIEIAKVNKKVVDNNTIASNLLIAKQSEVIMKQMELDKAKTQLQQEHQKNVQTTNKLHAAYAAYSLRFQATDGNAGQSGANTLSASGDQASNAASAVIQLPDKIARNLRQLAYDCDSLNDDYKLLYNASP